MSADDDSNLLVDLVIGNLFDKIDDKGENAIAMTQTKSEKPGGGKHPKQQKATSKEEGKRIAEENERRHQEKLRLRAEREKAQKAKKASTTEDDAGENVTMDAGGADESTSKKDLAPLILDKEQIARHEREAAVEWNLPKERDALRLERKRVHEERQRQEQEKKQARKLEKQRVHEEKLRRSKEENAARKLEKQFARWRKGEPQSKRVKIESAEGETSTVRDLARQSGNMATPNDESADFAGNTNDIAADFISLEDDHTTEFHALAKQSKSRKRKVKLEDEISDQDTGYYEDKSDSNDKDSGMARESMNAHTNEGHSWDDNFIPLAATGSMAFDTSEPKLKLRSISGCHSEKKQRKWGPSGHERLTKERTQEECLVGNTGRLIAQSAQIADDAEFNAQDADLHVQDISERRTKKRRSRKRKVQEFEVPPRLICYNCGNVGHLSEDCPQERKCLNCKKSNHEWKFCLEPKQCYICLAVDHISEDCPIMHSQHRREYLKEARYGTVFSGAENHPNKKTKVEKTSQESLADLERLLPNPSTGNDAPTDSSQEVVHWLISKGFKKILKRLEGLEWSELLKLDRNALIERGITREKTDILLGLFEKVKVSEGRKASDEKSNRDEEDAPTNGGKGLRLDANGTKLNGTSAPDEVPISASEAGSEDENSRYEHFDNVIQHAQIVPPISNYTPSQSQPFSSPILARKETPILPPKRVTPQVIRPPNPSIKATNSTPTITISAINGTLSNPFDTRKSTVILPPGYSSSRVTSITQPKKVSVTESMDGIGRKDVTIDEGEMEVDEKVKVVSDDWEKGPGHLQANIIATKGDTQENIAFSSKYITSQEVGVNFSNINFQILNLSPSVPWQVLSGLEEGQLLLCAVVEGRVSVKLGRESQQMFGVSKGGVWRIRGGEDCEVRNGSVDGQGKEDAVVHLVHIA